MRQLGLVRVERIGHAVVCSWNPENPASKALSRLLEELDSGPAGEPDDDTLFWNLRRFDAPLARAGSKGKELTLEETLGHALKLARRYPDVARVWPIVLARHRSEADLDALVRLAGRLREKRTLGFFLSLTRTLMKDPSLSRHESALRDRRMGKTQDFFPAERGERARALADLRTPDVAKRWHFRMNMPMESFQSAFDKFSGAR